MATRIEVAQRRSRLLQACHTHACSVSELAELLGVGATAVREDIEHLQQQFPGRLETIRYDGKNTYQWLDLPPVLIAHPPDHLDHWELVALIAARGLLRRPKADTILEDRDDPYDGPLDGAIDRLLRRFGLEEEAARIAPEAVQVSRFAALVEPAHHLEAAIAAVCTGDVLEGEYTNLGGQTKAVRLQPVRLVLIEGEWHLLANDGSRKPLVKDYRIARFRELRRSRQPPPGGSPPSVPQFEADLHLDAAFRAHGSTDPAHRRRVVLAVSPEGARHLRGRTWGADQRWEAEPADLPEGWERLSFISSGLPACRHWALSLGTLVQAEQPPELVEWMREEIKRLSESYYERSASQRRDVENHAGNSRKKAGERAI